MHQTSTYIEITGEMMKDQFCNGNHMTFDMFDIGIRCLRQLDAQMYPEGGDIRWCHWLESDFAMYVLAGEDPTKKISIKDQFLGSSITYEVPRCRMIAVPFQTSEYWCAYMWDMKKHVVHIIDPNFNGQNSQETIYKHDKTIKELQLSLAACVVAFFDGWEVEWENVVTSLPPSSCFNVNRYDTGLCTFYLMKHFDGTVYINVPSKDLFLTFEKSFLYELMGLRGNKGRPLPPLQQLKIENYTFAGLAAVMGVVTY